MNSVASTSNNNPDCCLKCGSWKVIYSTFKRKIVDTSSLLERYNKVNQDNSSLSQKVKDVTLLSKSLKTDCDNYEKELYNALQKHEPLKQLCSTLQAEVEQHAKQKTSLETDLESCKATLKQYENLLKEQKAPELGTRGRAKLRADKKDKVEALRKQLHDRNQELKKVQSKCRRALRFSKRVATRLKGKGNLTILDKKQLDRVRELLSSASPGGEDDSAESDNSEDGEENRLDDDALVLEKLLEDRSMAKRSDSDSDWCSVKSDTTLPKEPQGSKRKVKKKEATRAIPKPASKCTVAEPPVQATSAERPPDVTLDQQSDSGLLAKSAENSVLLEESSTEQNEYEAHQVSQDMPAALEGLPEKQQQKQQEQQQQLQEGLESCLPVLSVDVLTEENVIRSDVATKNEDLPPRKVNDPDTSNVPSHPAGELPKGPEVAVSEVVEHSGSEVAATCEENKSMAPKSSCLQVSQTAMHSGGHTVATSSLEADCCELQILERPQQVSEHQGLSAPQSSSNAVESAETASNDKCYEIDQDGDIEAIRAELCLITSEMCAENVLITPLSPLPLTPPPFAKSSAHFLNTQATSASEKATAALKDAITAPEEAVAAPEEAVAAPEKATAASEDNASVSAEFGCHPRKRRKGRKDRSLPFSSHCQGPSSADSSREQRRQFLHQKSEGFEPQVGNAWNDEDNHAPSASTMVTGHAMPPKDRLLLTKFSWHPINKSIQIDAKFPRESLAKSHVMPTITVEVDVAEYGFHMSFNEVPLTDEQRHVSPCQQGHDEPEMEDRGVTRNPVVAPPHSTRPAPVPLQTTTLLSDPPEFRMPLPKRTVVITPSSVLGHERRRERNSRIQTSSWLEGIPEIDECLEPVPTSIAETVSGTHRQLISPLPPSPSKGLGAGMSCKEVSLLRQPLGREGPSSTRRLSSALGKPVGDLQDGVPIKRRTSFGFMVPPSSRNSTDITADAPPTLPDVPEEQVMPVPSGKKRRISLLATKATPGKGAPILFETSATSSPSHISTSNFQGESLEAQLLSRKRKLQRLFSSDSSTDESAEVSPQRSTKKRPALQHASNVSAGLSAESSAGKTAQQLDASLVTEEVSQPIPKRKRVSLAVTNKEKIQQLPSTTGATAAAPEPSDMPADSAQNESSEANLKLSLTVPYAVYIVSEKHRCISFMAKGNLHSVKAVKDMLDKLAWLAAQPEVNPGVVERLAHKTQGSTEQVVNSSLVYLANTTANPLLAFFRQEQCVPLLTRMESLMLEWCDVLEKTKEKHCNLFNGFLSALRSRLFSPRRPKSLLGIAAYVRFVSAICRKMGDFALARVVMWDLLRAFRGNGVFLVAVLVGVWPEVLGTLPVDPRTDAVSLALRYLLFHAPHTLNPTLLAQVHMVFRQLGNVNPLEEGLTCSVVAKALFNSLKEATEGHHDSAKAIETKDLCLLHCLAMEELCKRSDSWEWCVDFALGKVVWPPIVEFLGHMEEAKEGRPLVLCLVWLLGDIWKHCEPASVPTLKSILARLEEFLKSDHTDFELKETVVRSLFKLPSLEEQESIILALAAWQKRHRDTLLQIPQFAKARSLFLKRSRKRLKKNRNKHAS